MNKYRFLIKTGPRAGEIHEGVWCNARATPESEPDTTKYKDGIYITFLSLRIADERDPEAKHCGQRLHFEDLVIPFDKYGKEIFVGDELYAAISKEVRKVKVTKIKDVYHVGCGWMQRKIQVEDLDAGKLLTINVPSHTIKV